MSLQDFFDSLTISLATKIFFFTPYCWLSYLLRHRNICCDKLDFANLISHSVFVETEFSSVVTELYHFVAFIVVTENFFDSTEILPSIIYYVAT